MSKKFIQVFIKSEANLPKEDGVYFVCYKRFKEGSTHFWKTNLARVNTWLTEVDWYLQPVEQSNPEGKEDAEQYYNNLGEWTRKQFPDAGSIEHLFKLQEETKEAIEDPSDVMEYADCVGAIFGAAYKAGLSFNDLLSTCNKKLQINKTRNWMKNSNGTYSHIHPSSETSKADHIADSGKKVEATMPVLIWYAERTNRNVSELDDYDVHVCKVAEEYAVMKMQNAIVAAKDELGKIREVLINFSKYNYGDNWAQVKDSALMIIDKYTEALSSGATIPNDYVKTDYTGSNLIESKAVEPSEQRKAEEWFTTEFKKVILGENAEGEPYHLGDDGNELKQCVAIALRGLQEYKAQGSVTDEEIEDIAKGRKPYKKYVDEDGFDCEHKFWFTDDQFGAIMSFWTNWLKNKLNVQNL